MRIFLESAQDKNRVGKVSLIYRLSKKTSQSFLRSRLPENSRKSPKGFSAKLKTGGALLLRFL